LQRADESPQNTPEIPPDSAQVLAAWHRLPEAVRAGILAMVKASSGGAE
jgi:hypothetical protein